MSSVRRGNDVFLLCRMLCICATWVRVATALPQDVTESSLSIANPSATFALIPKPTALVPSASVNSEPAPSGLIPSQAPPPGLIPSQTPPPGLIPSQTPPSGLIPSALIPSASIPSGLIPSMIVSPTLTTQTDASLVVSGTHGGATPLIPSMASTNEGLRPIPAPTTAPGDPDGHHEITEPNFTATAPCRGCSPVIEISATGFFDWPTTPAADHAGTSAALLSKATITAGPSEVIVSKEPSGGNFIIGDSTTVTPGQTVIIDNTPVVIQTTGGSTEVIVGTKTVPLQPNSPETASSQITEAPILSPLTVGSQTISADSASQYVVYGQTLAPGGPAITVDGTTVSLLPSATAIVVNGVTSTLAHAYGAIYTSTAPPLLTLNNEVYTANRAGYYILAPGTTLIPGGLPVTISGTTISLDPKGTEAIIQGTTSVMAPATTIVTLTKGGGGGGLGEAPYSSSPGGGLPPSTTIYSTKLASAGMSGRISSTIVAEGWLEGIFLLGIVGLGWLAVWL